MKKDYEKAKRAKTSKWTVFWACILRYFMRVSLCNVFFLSLSFSLISGLYVWWGLGPQSVWVQSRGGGWLWLAAVSCPCLATLHLWSPARWVSPPLPIRIPAVYFTLCRKTVSHRGPVRLGCPPTGPIAVTAGTPAHIAAHALDLTCFMRRFVKKLGKLYAFNGLVSSYRIKSGSS